MLILCVSQSYNLSKLINLLAMREFAGKSDGPPKPKIVVNCVNPGFCQPALSKQEKVLERIGVSFAKMLVARKAEEGSRTLVHELRDGRAMVNIFLTAKLRDVSTFELIIIFDTDSIHK
jgi:hypothetical protein